MHGQLGDHGLPPSAECLVNAPHLVITGPPSGGGGAGSNPTSDNDLRINLA
jgi:hypothetical protein